MLKARSILLLGAAIAAAAWWSWDQPGGPAGQLRTQLGIWLPARAGRTEPAAPARARPAGAVVSAATAERRDVPVMREGIGSVVAGALVTVKAQVDGRLMAVEFRDGETVRKGQVLARLDRASFEAQLEQALARQAQNEAALNHAQMELERFERLASANAGTRQQADQQRAVVAQLRAQLRADRATVDAARINLDHTVIIAPTDGRAGIRQVDPGNIVRASDPMGIVTLAQIQPLAVVFALPQRDLTLLQSAVQRGVVEAHALATDGRTALATGRLDVIDNQIDQATGTIRLKASFPNEDLRLWPGQFVNVRVKLDELRAAIVVPTPSVRRGAAGLFVYIIDGAATARVRPVEIAQQDENLTVVTAGLNFGDKVVTAGFHLLRDGASVVISDVPDVGNAASDASERPQQ